MGRDGIEKIRSGGNTKVGKIARELTSKADRLVNSEGAAEVWIIDETGPFNTRAWFLVKGY